MIASRRRSIEERLASLPVPERPPGLAEAIKREIPPGLRLLPPPPEEAPRSRHYWQLAAALFVTVAGGLLCYHLLRESGPGRAQRPVTPRPPLVVRPLESSVPAQRPDSALQAAVVPGVADVRVRVVDPEGRPLAGATVTLGRVAGGRVATTDRRGVARFRSLRAGTYPLRGELAGFTTVERSGLRIAGGHGVVVELTLPAPLEESLTVTVAAPQTDARSIAVGAMVSNNGGLSPLLASTGGTAEPNDQPYGDMFFRSYGVNPFVETDEDALSTFGLDVDTGSYTLASAYLRDGHLPPTEAIRVEEFVNAFRYGDAAVDDRADFTLRAEGSPSPFAAGARYRLLRFHLRARTVDPAERPPAILTFVVDVSGSMAREDRLGLVKRALALLLDQLRPGDRVGLVVFGSQGRVLLPHTADHERLRAAINELEPEGSTNAEEGLRLAYDLAAQARREGAINRVILCSDGVANVGATGPDSILARISEEAKRGIELTTVGFGMGNYNDVLMEQLADRGNGHYAYVDRIDEARRVFVEDLTGTLQTIAADAKVQVEFNPRVVERWRLLGYENRDIEDERFRDDRVDAGEIGAGHEVTALYEVKLRPLLRRGGPVVATLRLRYRPVGANGPGPVVETAHELRARDIARSWEKASPGLRLAAVVAELAEVLKKSYWARGSTLAEVARRAQAATADFPGDQRVGELAELAARAAALASAAPTATDEDASPETPPDQR
ncbi:MAG TPA: von Willebrand factor type A domain-containing protein [Thermoanaerobaculia bacterium]|jgi:Ca-activated chloride channel family protein|nr:von Willebrand factor type A domain-containing protein [Thermoanaerobaculia bacterium]